MNTKDYYLNRLNIYSKYLPIVGISIYWYYLYLLSQSVDPSPQITFLIIIYAISFPIYVFDSSRRYLVSLLGFENFSPKFQNIYFPLMSIFPFFIIGVLFSIASNDPVPEILKFSFIAVSSTMGGLVLTSANNNRLNDYTRSEFVNIAKKFVIASVLIIAFSLFNPLIDKLPNTQSIATFKSILLWVVVFSFYIGMILFLTGVIELIITLNKIKLYRKSVSHILQRHLGRKDNTILGYPKKRKG